MHTYYCQAGTAAVHPGMGQVAGKALLSSHQPTMPGKPAPMATAWPASLWYYRYHPQHLQLQDKALGSLERGDLLSSCQNKGFAMLHILFWSQKYLALGLSAWDNWPWHCFQLRARNSYHSDLSWRKACNCKEYLLTIFSSFLLCSARTSRQKCSEGWKAFYVDEHMKRWLCIAKSLILG